MKIKRRFCPNCKKPTLTPWLGFCAGIIYFCKNCGYKGPLSITKVLKNKKGKNN
jgi:RNase P subunit RPR2